MKSTMVMFIFLCSVAAMASAVRLTNETNRKLFPIDTNMISESLIDTNKLVVPIIIDCIKKDSSSKTNFNQIDYWGYRV